MKTTTSKAFSESIGRSGSTIRQQIVMKGIVPVGTIKVAPKSSAFLYNEEDLKGIKLRRKNRVTRGKNG